MAKNVTAKKPEAESDRKPFRWGRVRERLARQLDKLVATNESDFTEEVNIAVRERLERHQLWPDTKD